MLKTDKLSRDFSRTGLSASKAWGRLAEHLVAQRRLGHVVALTGPVGVGKPTLIHNVTGAGQTAKTLVVSESQALEQANVTIALSGPALGRDFGAQPARDRERRERQLCPRIEKSPRPVVLGMDDAHRPQGFEEGEQPISREPLLNVIAPDVRALRTERKRLG